jgi:two-component system cell cycle response regulator DivK
MQERILLVEDDPGTIDVLLLELEYLGYQIKVAKNGVEAVEMAISELPDLIVMDICLPKMDGLQAASLIRNNPKTKGIPLLAATVNALPGDREKCLRGGCHGYIAKPFTHRELGAAIKKLLQEFPAGRETVI